MLLPENGRGKLIFQSEWGKKVSYVWSSQDTEPRFYDLFSLYFLQILLKNIFKCS